MTRTQNSRTMRASSPIRRKLLIVAAAATLAPAAALAQSSGQPIRIVVPYTPGGTGEMMARLVAEKMTTSMGRPVVVDNRPGGGTTIGAAVVARAPADGHAIFMNASSFLINSQLMEKLPYDPVKDFVPVTYAAANPHVLVVSPSLGISTMKEFMALVKDKGSEMSYGSFGNGSSGHLAFELLKSAYRFPMQHVPYKGAAQAMTDVMAGQIQAMLADLPASFPHIQSGKLVALGVASKERAEIAKSIPTLTEAGGIEFESGSWFGFLLKTGTPPEVAKQLHSEIVKALSDNDLKQQLRSRGMETFGTSEQEFARFMERESARFAEAIRISGAKIE